LGISALKSATEAINGKYTNIQFYSNINIFIYYKIDYYENVYKLVNNTTENIDPNLSVKLQILEDKKNKIYNNAYENANKYR